jgi:pilus assembly protein CpaB
MATESEQSGGSRIYMVAGALAVGAGLLAWGSLKSKQAEITEGWEPHAVLMATRNLPAGTILDQDMLEPVSVPKRFVTDSIAPGSHRSAVIDSKLLYPMKEGDMLNFNMLKNNQNVDALSKRLVPGSRAVALRVSVESSVNRMVRPNDHVDMLLTFRDPTTRMITTTTLLENIVVLATGEILGGAAIGYLDDEARKYVTVTVDLTPKEVEIAIQAQSMGQIYMSMRHPDDPEVLDDLARTNVDTILTGERARQLRDKRTKRVRLPTVIKGADK